jgi:hypothetical protein
VQYTVLSARDQFKPLPVTTAKRRLHSYHARFQAHWSIRVANTAPLLLGISVLSLLLACLVAAKDLFDQGQALPEILSATRLKQSPAAGPVSITVIDRALIEASGARDIPELMRLVPGMVVGYVKGNEITLNYHGDQVGSARRLQVLIDGRSVYCPRLATVDWTDLALAMEDIERIEVFRGPDTRQQQILYKATLLVLFALALTLAFILARRLARHLSEPLSAMGKAVSAIHAGNYQPPA